MTVRSACQVCGKALRSLRSVSLGVGPVCARRVRAIIEGVMTSASQVAATIAERAGEVYRSALFSAQEAYRNRIRRRRQQENGQEDTAEAVPQDVNVTGVWSESRGRNDDIRIEFSDSNHAIARSASGHTYNVTETTCSCPHYVHRLQRTGGTCRHIDAFISARNATAGAQSVSATSIDRTDSLAVEITEELHEANRRRFFEIDWTEEQEREQVLNIWRENRGFDGIYMSENDEAWRELYERAGEDWDYRYENVLGGTGNSFGIELEFEMPSNVSKADVANALYQADILDNPRVLFYHAGESYVGPGYWRLETDGSLNNGLELVSPVLYDRPEHWQQIEKATRVLRELGVRTSVRTGGHIHVGIAPMDHRTYSWQRLSRIGLAYERIFYRLGGADAQRYEQTGTPGVHRGSDYTQPLTYEARFIRGTDTAAEARARLSPTRYTLFNATNVDADTGRKPTLEMRYPNGTLDHRQIQAQVMVANAVVHQAAVIRNEEPQNRFTPGLGMTGRQYRLADGHDPAREEKSFRQFLDVLGNPDDRFAATWLFRRGSVN